MLKLLTRSMRGQRPAPVWRARLAVECLEARNCPSAPEITLTVTIVDHPNRIVRLSGTVTDENPATVAISFSGAVLGSATPDSSGRYSVDFQAETLGTVYAEAVDEEWLTDVASAQVASQAPVISDFAAVWLFGNVWKFRGRVTDEHAVGLGVLLGGIPSLRGVTATVNSDGWFEATVELAPDEEGTVTAQTWDWWDLESNVAEALIRQP
ncbi:MAG TPA: hypothetical protein VNK04_06915 [Gemmataceae bacterium]|nr:hypothetical protein [Gemmataceae bacterium]